MLIYQKKVQPKFYATRDARQSIACAPVTTHRTVSKIYSTHLTEDGAAQLGLDEERLEDLSLHVAAAGRADPLVDVPVVGRYGACEHQQAGPGG